jgi:hypothetical protein
VDKPLDEENLCHPLKLLVSLAQSLLLLLELVVLVGVDEWPGPLIGWGEVCRLGNDR